VTSTRRLARLVPAVVVLVLLGAASTAASRYEELKRVIDRNTGHAHMTRGMNMYTLIALRECVTQVDIPVLTQLLSDHDSVTRMTAAEVLVDMGPPGRRALETARMGTTDARMRSMLDDALREADSPTRRPLADYPLTDVERRSIRSCVKKPSP
jgi:hypothetical protein